MQTISISTGKPYQVLIGTGLLARTGTLLNEFSNVRKVAVVTDDRVAPLYLQTVTDSFSEPIAVSHIIVRHGETAKCADNLMTLLSFFCQEGLTRTDLVIALGGGVIGDLTGFAASCYLRGIRYVQIPTTLLAQVDSSVGGKTAINIPEGKNLVGSFYQPSKVLCDTDTLDTLTPEDFSGGLGEVIKYGCIWDASLFEQIGRMQDKAVRAEVVARCIQIKADIVAQDEHDTGLRMILNFGHTLGHAVEKYHHYRDYTHGEGVAIGMVAITRMAESKGLTPIGCADRMEALCKACGLPTACDVPKEELLRTCALDKKNMGAELRLILLNDIGSCRIVSMSQTEFSDFLGA